MSVVNPTFETGDDQFQGEPVFYCTADPDPGGRFQNYRDGGGMFAGDPPESITEDDYFWGVYFSASVRFNEGGFRPSDVDPESLDGLSSDDVRLLHFCDHLTGEPITAEGVLLFADRQNRSKLRSHCLSYLNRMA